MAKLPLWTLIPAFIVGSIFLFLIYNSGVYQVTMTLEYLIGANIIFSSLVLSAYPITYFKLKRNKKENGKSF